MSGGAPGPRGFVAGHSGVVSSVLMCHELAAHDVSVAGYSFPKAIQAKPSQAKLSQGVNWGRRLERSASRPNPVSYPFLRLTALLGSKQTPKLYQGNMLALTIL